MKATLKAIRQELKRIEGMIEYNTMLVQRYLKEMEEGLAEARGMIEKGFHPTHSMVFRRHEEMAHALGRLSSLGAHKAQLLLIEMTAKEEAAKKTR